MDVSACPETQAQTVHSLSRRPLQVKSAQGPKPAGEVDLLSGSQTVTETCSIHTLWCEPVTSLSLAERHVREAATHFTAVCFGKQREVRFDARRKEAASCLVIYRTVVVCFRRLTVSLSSAGTPRASRNTWRRGPCPNKMPDP